MSDSERLNTFAALMRAGSAMTGAVLVSQGVRGVFLGGIRRVGGAIRFAGPAATVRFLPTREDLATESYLRDPAYPQRLAADEAAAGSVMVYAIGSPSTVATAGEFIVNRLAIRGAAALVTDGFVRDSAAVCDSPLAVFAAGLGPAGHTIAQMAVDFGSPIACGGVHIQPGDVLVGDEDGVVCVPRALADGVALQATRRTDLEVDNMNRLRAGASLAEIYVSAVGQGSASRPAAGSGTHENGPRTDKRQPSRRS